jgi:hypothetical protein
MSTTSHEPMQAMPEPRRWSPRAVVPEVWTSLAISAIWLAVAVVAMSGPNVVINNSSGMTSIPSAVFVALFAWLATRVVARYGFERKHDDN